jgi:ElaB/YqjD/DUF883 family membrane-anchored ribosome-binding protein
VDGTTKTKVEPPMVPATRGGSGLPSLALVDVRVQHRGEQSPGQGTEEDEAPMPTTKKPATKPATKKAATGKSTAKKPAAKKPAARTAAKTPAVKEATAERQSVQHLLARRLDDSAERLRDLGARVQDQTEDVRGRLRPFLGQARSDWEALESIVHRLGDAAGGAWGDLAAGAKEASERLEAELSTIRADLRAEAASSADAYGDALADLVDAAKVEIGRLREHASQATSDAKDEAVAAVDRAEGALEALKDSVGKTRGHAVASTEDLRRDARQLVDDLRQATSEAASRLRPNGAGETEAMPTAS